MRRMLPVFLGLLFCAACSGPRVACYLPEGVQPVPIDQIVASVPANLPKPIYFGQDQVDGLVREIIAAEGATQEAAFAADMFVASVVGFYLPPSNRIYIKQDTLMDKNYILLHELAHATGPILGRECSETRNGMEHEAALQQKVQEEVVAELTTFILFAEAGKMKPGGTDYLDFNLKYANPGPLKDIYPQAQEAAEYILGRKPAATCEITESDCFYYLWPVIREVSYALTDLWGNIAVRRLPTAWANR